uniref:Uncharacterized protein n=1 Tax=Panagrolaimus sp. JU765 TaxID=591449 RepID=A0AC34QNM4_9BILA
MASQTTDSKSSAASGTSVNSVTDKNSSGNNNTDGKENSEVDKIDISTDDKREVNVPKPEDNVALPLPGTQSTYQRVEKGTRTALLYWDGWLTAQDAKQAEDDPNYFTKTQAVESGKALKRNTNLKKNWTYGPNGEVQYISTGFAGVFDKGTGGKSGVSSSYGLVGDKNIGGGALKLEKPTGPAVGTIWDLKGNAKDRSAYADVTSSKGALKVSKNDDKDYYTKSATQNRSAYGASGGKSGPGSAYMEVGATGSGYSSNRMNRGPSAGQSGHYADGGKSGPGSAYMEVGGHGSSNLYKTGKSGSNNTASGYSDVQSGYNVLNKNCNQKIGYGMKFDKATGKYMLVDEDNYKGPYSANGAPYRLNWKYGANKEILYVPTGFVSIFGKQENIARNQSGPGGAATGNCGTANVAGGSGTTSNRGPVLGTIWDLKGNAKDRSAYADVTSSKSALKASKNEDKDYYTKSANQNRSGTGSAYMEVGATGSGYSSNRVNRGTTVGQGGHHADGGKSGPGSAYMEVGATGTGYSYNRANRGTSAGQSGHYADGGKSGPGSAYMSVGATGGGYSYNRANRGASAGQSGHYTDGGKSGPGSAYMEVGGHGSSNLYKTEKSGNNGAAGGYSDGQSGNNNLNKNNNQKVGYGMKFDKATGKYVVVDEDNYKGPHGANGAPYRINWKYGANKEIVYLPTGFVSIFEKAKM